MKKIINIFLIVFFFFWILSNVSAYQVPVTLELKELTIPLKNKGIDVTINNSSYRYLTDEEGKIHFTYEYSEYENKLNLRIDWNSVLISEPESSLREVQIEYSTEENKIIDVITSSGSIKIFNQEVLKSSNYKLLLVYIFFSIIVFIVLWGWRVMYNLLLKDIINHNS